MLGKRFLIAAPHTDDAELGCGGIIARLVEEELEVYVAAFSIAEDSLPPHLPANTLQVEFNESMSVLGLPAENVRTYQYPVRRLSYHRQEILEDLVHLRREVNPDIVLLPSATDLHQDHHVLHIEGLRAFKDLTVWGYELPWNQIDSTAQGFVTLERRHLEAKWAALSCYRSQIEMKRSYMSLEFIEGLARVRGTQIKAEFAEAFQVLRLRI